MADLSLEVAESHALAPHQTGASRSESLGGKPELFYSEDEARDEAGRWTSGGEEGGGASVTKADVRVTGSGKYIEKVRAAIDGLPDRVKAAAGPVVVVSTDKVIANGHPVLGSTPPVEHRGETQLIKVADRVTLRGQSRWNADPGGTAIHEFGHALDNVVGLSGQLEATMAEEANRLGEAQKILANHYFKNPREMFAELFRLTYGGKKAFCMGRAKALKRFPKSVAAIKERLG